MVSGLAGLTGAEAARLLMRASAFFGLAVLLPSVAAGGPSRSADEIAAEVRRATAAYLDIARARADGFVRVSGMEARHGYHFMNVTAPVFTAAGLAAGTLDLGRPPILLYVERDGAWRLAGVEYALRSPPAPNPFPGAEWHQHEASCHYRDYREIPARRAGDCPALHPESGAPFVLWHPEFAVAHVWAWIPSPDGPFAETNRALAGYRGTASAGPGHRHPRSATEVAYSQVSHRAAGAILMLLALVIAWETWRRRPLARSALSSALWILFGLYLIPTTDPESWPWGPRPFEAIFTDPLVLQHKILALVPIAIGVISALRGAGVVPPARGTALVAALAVFGGASLFVHSHDGHFHLDAIYLQHAAAGTTAVALGIVLFIARRAERVGARDPTLIRWAWPGLVAVLAFVLLFYVER